jgi:hypothetical protein
MLAIYTHAGCRLYTGHYAVTADAIRKPGRVHALNATARRGVFRALCGTTVHEGSDDHSRQDDGPNVWPTTPGHRITCKRCRAVLDRKTY